MKVLIFSAFDGVPYSGEEHMRYAAITEEFLRNGHEVCYISSAFSHIYKSYRKISDLPKNLQVVLLQAKGYTSNYSIDRVLSYQRLSVSLADWLGKLKEPDFPQLVIGASPPLSANYILAKFCKKNKIPFIYDIQDLWPEEFLKVFPVKGILRFILKPYFKLAATIVKIATAVTAVSTDYLEYYKTQIAKKPSNVFYLGTNTEKFANAGETLIEKKIILLGHSQSGYFGIEAARAVQSKNGMRLTVAGLKERSKSFGGKILQENLHSIDVIPWFDKKKIYVEMPSFAVSLVLLDPVSKSAFPNRVFTYFAAGLPVINTIIGGELERCILDNNLGITISFAGNENDKQKQLQDAIEYCLENFPISEHQRIQDFARKNFDRKDIYKRYCDWAMEIINYQ